MFASINFNMLMTMAIGAGCIASKAFAAAVVCGAFGVFIACAIIFTKSGNNSPLTRLRAFIHTL